MVYGFSQALKVGRFIRLRHHDEPGVVPSIRRLAYLDFALAGLRITFHYRRGDVAEWLKAAVC